MNKNKPDSNTKKARYIASIIYILILTFIVGGSYINQQNTLVDKHPTKPKLDHEL